MTSPQGPAREKRWRVDDVEINRVWTWETGDPELFAANRVEALRLAVYLNALEAERDTYRAALERICIDPNGWESHRQTAREALALSSVGSSENASSGPVEPAEPS